MSEGADVMTIGEAAAFLRVSRTYLRTITGSGRVVAVVQGRRVTYLKDDLLAYLRGQRRVRVSGESVTWAQPPDVEAVDFAARRDAAEIYNRHFRHKKGG